MGGRIEIESINRMTKKCIAGYQGVMCVEEEDLFGHDDALGGMGGRIRNRVRDSVNKTSSTAVQGRAGLFFVCQDAVVTPHWEPLGSRVPKVTFTGSNEPHTQKQNLCLLTRKINVSRDCALQCVLNRNPDARLYFLQGCTRG